MTSGCDPDVQCSIIVQPQHACARRSLTPCAASVVHASFVDVPADALAEEARRYDASGRSCVARWEENFMAANAPCVQLAAAVGTPSLGSNTALDASVEHDFASSAPNQERSRTLEACALNATNQ